VAGIPVYESLLKDLRLYLIGDTCPVVGNAHLAHIPFFACGYCDLVSLPVDDGISYDVIYHGRKGIIGHDQTPAFDFKVYKWVVLDDFIDDIIYLVWFQVAVTGDEEFKLSHPVDKAQALFRMRGYLLEQLLFGRIIVEVERAL